MRRAIVEPLKCKNCTNCLVEINCPKFAIIRETKEDKPWIDFYKCCGCMNCRGFCTENAISEITHPCNSKPGKSW